MRTLPKGLLLATALLATGALLATALPVAGADPATSPTAVQFGMDAASVSALTAAGVAPDYGTFWIGPWTLSSGWGGPDGQLTAMKNAGVTPAIHFYYWGDDISPNCVENGCWSSLHNAQKDRAHWDILATQMTDHLTSKMGGEPAVIFLESEFNKGGIETYEAFDGYMAAMADKIHAAYPSAIIVLGFGNWGSTNWKNFDRAAAASDMVGIQGMRGSTKQSQTDMYTLYDGLLAGVKTLETTFPGTPIMLTDIAVSSYPEPGYLSVQSGVLGEVFDNLATLKSHGVEAMIYRSWKDSPNMDTANYYGEAERHWGMAWASNGTQKAAGKVWVDGVKAERSASAPPPNSAPTASFTAAGSQLSVNVDASTSADADGQALTYSWAWGDGAVSTGKTATHAYAASGTYTIGLTVSDGTLTATASKAVTVTKPVSTTTTTSSSPTSSTTTTTSSTAYTATVSPSSSSNEWWVQAGVSPAPAKVEVKAGSGAWTTLDKQSYGWTKSIHVTKGTMVQFRVTSLGGQTATTPAKAWLVDMSPQKATSTSSTTTTSTTPTSSTTTTTSATKTTTSSTSTTTASFRASFSPKSVGNDWWVESAVTANQPIAKVEAKVNSGSWVVLPKQDWGNYAKSINAPNGSHVTLRATSTTGAQYSSIPYTWT